MPREAVMTRKHYEAIAGAINAHNLNSLGYEAARIRQEFAHDMAKLFASTDRSFNTELFLASALKGDRKRAQKLTNGASASSQNGGQKFTETENTGRDF